MDNDNSNLCFACIRSWDSYDEFFDFKRYVFRFCNSFVPDYESIYYAVLLNNIINDTLVDSISDKEIVLKNLVFMMTIFRINKAKHVVTIQKGI